MILKVIFKALNLGILKMENWEPVRAKAARKPPGGGFQKPPLDGFQKPLLDGFQMPLLGALEPYGQTWTSAMGRPSKLLWGAFRKRSKSG